MSEIVCKCGHEMSIHDMTGCNFPRPYAPEDCMCTLSPEAIEARNERDALQTKLDEATEALKYYARNDIVWHNPEFAEEALAKLEEI